MSKEILHSTHFSVNLAMYSLTVYRQSSRIHLLTVYSHASIDNILTFYRKVNKHNILTVSRHLAQSSNSVQAVQPPLIFIF
jgi:hypothetical protein